MKLELLLRHIADNVENGRGKLDGLKWTGPNAIRRLLSEPNCFSLATRTHEINGFEVPAPEVEALNDGDEYYIPDPASHEWYVQYNWEDDCLDYSWLRRGLIHLTMEAAIANAKAMLGDDPSEECEE